MTIFPIILLFYFRCEIQMFYAELNFPLRLHKNTSEHSVCISDGTTNIEKLTEHFQSCNIRALYPLLCMHPDNPISQ